MFAEPAGSRGRGEVASGGLVVAGVVVLDEEVVAPGVAEGQEDPRPVDDALARE